MFYKNLSLYFTGYVGTDKRNGIIIISDVRYVHDLR